MDENLSNDTNLLMNSSSGGVTPVSDFLGADSMKRDLLIPRSPGLYAWLHNPDSWPTDTFEEFNSALQEILGEIGQSRTRILWPYWRVTIKERRKEISDEKASSLWGALRCADSELAQWVRASALRFQRPLYVGMAVNLQRRIADHLRQTSLLRTRLESASVDLFDCVVSWTHIPDGALIGQEMDSENTAEDADLDSSGERLSALLRSVEALLIRLSMPLFNERLE